MTLTVNEYYTQRPARVSLIKALEFYHPSYGTLRFCYQTSDRVLGVESDAPRNAGEMVEYQALAFQISAPSQQDVPNVNIAINLGRVGSELKSKMKLVRGFDRQTPHEIIYREYFSDNMSAPSRLWQVYSGNINFDQNSVTVNAEDENPTTRDWSRKYTVEDFPGLQLV